MAGEEGHVGIAPLVAAVVAAEADAAAPGQGAESTVAEQNRTYRMPPKVVEELLSFEHKPTPLWGDDDESEHKEMWNEAVDFFNQLKKELAVSQAKLREEQETKGFVELDDEYYDEVAKRSQASLEDYLEAKADLDAFVEKLNRARRRG
jgi:hypothetical protein